MNSRSLIGFVALTLAVLLGCSTSKTASTIQAAPPSVPSQPPLVIEWRNPPQSAVEPPGQFCLLGTTCLAMDPRPFEPCLLSSRHCKDKPAEPMQVAPPRWIVPEPDVDSLQVPTSASPQ
jgi:hypothetical protein